MKAPGGEELDLMSSQGTPNPSLGRRDTLWGLGKEEEQRRMEVHAHVWGLCCKDLAARKEPGTHPR